MFGILQHIYLHFYVGVQLDVQVIYIHSYKIMFRLPGCVCSCDLYGSTETIIPGLYWLSLAHVYFRFTAWHAPIIFNV
jgi:hypothetical protein